MDDREGNVAMPSVQIFQNLAVYNEWMNKKVYATVAELPDEIRKEDKGAFFKSIHSTLNHIVFGDRAWMNRLAGTHYDLKPIGQDLFSEFGELRRERSILDQAIIQWTQSLRAEDLETNLTWISGADGKERTHLRGWLLAHMFNHQTHHRGQVTTLLSQLGKDVGSTDMPFLPGTTIEA